MQFGDVRQPLDCEYIAQLCFGAQGQPHIAAGNKMYAYLFLAPRDLIKMLTFYTQ